MFRRVSDEYVREGKCFILNTNSAHSYSKIGHWVSFYKLNGKIWYYDSFNRSSKDLSKYWAKRKLYCANTSDRDQSFLSSDCGSRAMGWIILIHKWGERAIDVIQVSYVFVASFMSRL